MDEYSFEDLKTFTYQMKEFRKIERRINALDCRRCNGTISEANWICKITPLLARAEKMASWRKLRPYHQGDPRGCSLYLVPQKWDALDCSYSNGIACCV